ncbi:MAG: hypothetical protein WD187_03350 [Candidatus Woykebacteria bacterium]
MLHTSPTQFDFRRLVTYYQIKVLKKIQTAINNPLDLRNFFVLFAVGFTLLFTSYLLTVTFEGLQNPCPAKNMNFADTLPGRTSRTFGLIYKGGGSCNIVISPRDNNYKDLSLWVYKPGEEITVSRNHSYESNLIIEDSEPGLYRISVHNNANTTAEFQIKVAIVPKQR